MQWKQHRNFKTNWFAALFLFFNCICTATPVLRVADEHLAGIISTEPVQFPTPLENEEENHAFPLGYTNHVHHFSIRRHGDNRVRDAVVFSSADLSSNRQLSINRLPGAHDLPIHGSDAFIFRYTLFWFFLSMILRGETCALHQLVISGCKFFAHYYECAFLKL